MPAQGSGATRDQGLDDACLVVSEVREIPRVFFEDVSQFRPRATRAPLLAVRHALHPSLLAPQPIERAPRLVEVVLSEMGVPLRGLKTPMTQQGLDFPDVRAVLQKVGGKGVTKGVE